MSQEILGFIADVGHTFLKNVPISLALAAVFTVLTAFWACNPGVPWYRKSDISEKQFLNWQIRISYRVI